MQGVDTALFSLCHGNNTKPNCPPILPVNLHLFCFPFSPLSLSGMYCQLSRGAFQSLPASFTSPWNQLHYAGPFSVPPYRRKDGPALGIYSPCSRPQSHLQHLLNPPRVPLKRLSSLAFNCCSFFLLPMKFLLTASKEGLVVFCFFVFFLRNSQARRCVTRYPQHTAVAAGCLPRSLTVLSELSPHPWLSAVL